MDQPAQRDPDDRLGWELADPETRAPPTPAAPPPSVAADLAELETLPASPPPATSVHAAGLALPEQTAVVHDFDATGPADDRIIPVVDDLMAERERSLVAYRRRADAAVQERHLRIARRLHAEARLWSAAIATAGIALCVGPWIAAGWGVLLWLALAPRCLLSAAGGAIRPLTSVAACTACIVPLLTGGRTAERIAAGLLALVAAAAPWIHRWLVAAMPDPLEALGADPDGRLAKPGLHDPAAELRRQARHQCEVERSNELIRQITLRLVAARTAAAGALLLLAGLFAASIGGQIGHGTTAGDCLGGVAGAMLGWWIGWHRPTVVTAMAVFGLGAIVAHIALLAAGLAGLQAFTAFWIWLGWAIAGGMFALTVGLGGDAVAQRTT
jgi:hypothetical protein